jgi:aminoglycoside/choline kinase family phosphotransferase
MAELDERARVERAVRDAFGPGAAVEAIEPLHGDASSRRYLRARLAGAAVPTCVVMLLGEGRFVGGADELGGGAAPGELPFVNVGRYLAAHDFPVPRLYADRARDAGLLVLEDVGDVTLWSAVDAEPARTASLFGDAVDLLVRLQRAGAQAPDAGCVAFRRRFDAALARAELAHYVDHGIETRHGVVLSAGERAELLALLEPVVTPFDGGPLVLSHRDYMAWNLHVSEGRLRLIDFQDALIAPDAFDLAQLLTDRTTEQRVDATLERALVARFEAGSAAAGIPLAPGFADRYRRCALQHVFKVIGRFHLLELVKRKPGYLAYLPSVYAVGRRMLGALPELAPALPVLRRWTPELLEDAAS